MKYVETLLKGVNEKYSKMLNNKNENPFDSSMKIENYEEYIKRRDAYYNRLIKEKNTFNDAIDKVSKINEENIKKYDKDRRKLKKSLHFAIISIAVIIFVLYLGLTRIGFSFTSIGLITTISTISVIVLFIKMFAMKSKKSKKNHLLMIGLIILTSIITNGVLISSSTSSSAFISEAMVEVIKEQASKNEHYTYDDLISILGDPTVDTSSNLGGLANVSGIVQWSKGCKDTDELNKKLENGETVPTLSVVFLNGKATTAEYNEISK